MRFVMMFMMTMLMATSTYAGTCEVNVKDGCAKEDDCKSKNTGDPGKYAYKDGSCIEVAPASSFNCTSINGDQHNTKGDVSEKKGENPAADVGKK